MEMISSNKPVETLVTPDHSDEISLMPRVTIIPRGIAKVLSDSEPLVPEPTPEDLAQDQVEVFFREANDLLEQTGVQTKIKDGGNAKVTRYAHEVVTEDGEVYYAFLAQYDKWKSVVPPRRNPLTGIRVIHSRTNDPNNLDVSLEDGGINFKEDEDGNVDLYSLDTTVGQPVVNSPDHLAYLGAIIADIQEEYTHTQQTVEQTVEEVDEDKKKSRPEFTKQQKIIAITVGAVAVAGTMLGIAKQFTESAKEQNFPEYSTSFVPAKNPNDYSSNPNYSSNPTVPPKEELLPKGDVYIEIPDAPPAVITDAPQPPNRPVPPTEAPSNWNDQWEQPSNTGISIFIPNVSPQNPY